MLGVPAKGPRYDGLERVCAPGRATRSADWPWICRRPMPGAHMSRRSPHGSGRPAAVPDASNRRSGSPNRGPPKTRTVPLTKPIRVLSSGIDSLYVSFRGEPKSEALDALRRLKGEATESGQPQVLQLPGATKALVQPTGWGRYRFWLRSDGFDVFLGSGRGLPTTYARLLSSFIHEVGPTSALAEVNLFVNGPVLAEIKQMRCSRVDIYADFQGWVPRSDDYQRFVVRSRKNTGTQRSTTTAAASLASPLAGTRWWPGFTTRASRLRDRVRTGCVRSGVTDWIPRNRCGVLSFSSAGRC